MPSLNKVQLIGNLGRDPELRYMPSGDAIANLAIATSYKSKDKNTGEVKEHTEWHRISLFGKLAELAGQYLKKGSSIYLEGRLQTRKYQKDGVDHYATEIVGDSMQFLGPRPDDGGQQRPAAAPARPQQKPPAGAVQGQRHPGPGDMDWDDIPF